MEAFNLLRHRRSTGLQGEGWEVDFLDVSMYWSQFSIGVYAQVLAELGAIELMRQADTKEFLGDQETSHYLLVESPKHAGSDDEGAHAPEDDIEDEDDDDDDDGDGVTVVYGP